LREFWALFDAKGYEALSAMMTVDTLATDDFAKVWLRGYAAIGENFARIGELSEDSHTVLRDVRVIETSALAVVTCVVHYEMRWRGQPTSVDADDNDLRPRVRSVERRTAAHEVAGRARYAQRSTGRRRPAGEIPPINWRVR
jgi:hypothetical protein